MEIEKVLPSEVGNELSRFPLHHAIPLSIIRIDKRGQTKSINNGTLSLIQCGIRKFGLTNYHVYSEFLKGHEEFSTRIYLGSEDFTGRIQLISMSEAHDLVSLDLSDISEADLSSEGDIPTSFFRITSFSEAEVKEGDWLTLGGYPGEFREQDGHREFSYFSFSYGGAEVNFSDTHRIYTEFDIGSCMKSGVKSDGEIPDLGGLSGCPAFVPRTSEAGFLFYQFAGVFYEFGDLFQVAKLKPASLISDQGVIADEVT